MISCHFYFGQTIFSSPKSMILRRPSCIRTIRVPSCWRGMGVYLVPVEQDTLMHGIFSSPTTSPRETLMWGIVLLERWWWISLPNHCKGTCLSSIRHLYLVPMSEHFYVLTSASAPPSLHCRSVLGIKCFCMLFFLPCHAQALGNYFLPMQA